MYFYSYVYVFLLLCRFCSLYYVSIVLFYVLFLCICVLYYCHRVATQLQLTNISYHIISYNTIYHIISHQIIYHISNSGVAECKFPEMLCCVVGSTVLKKVAHTVYFLYRRSPFTIPTQ
jgi:hypothetical protein